MVKVEHWTEAAIVQALRRLWPSGAYVVLPQVRNGTGYARARNRTADAIVASVWPSNGLWLAGVEVKLSRADLRKELQDPSKSEAIAKYCQRWYVAGPSQLFGDTELEMLPVTWGIVACAANKTEIRRPATVREAASPDMLFLCSVLRAIEDCTVLRESVTEQIRAAVDVEVKRQADNADWKSRELQKSVEAFEQASGVKIADRWDSGEIGNAVAMIRSCGLSKAASFVRCMRKAAANFEREASAALEMVTGEKSATP